MNYLLILLAVSMAVSGLGWIYFIYFFSIGYGFGVSALAVTLAVLFKDVLTVPTALLCVVMFIFGCRLGLYLLTREKRSPEYKKILYGPDAAKKKPLFVVIMVWIFCALLYVGQVSPVAFFLANDAADAPVNELWAWIGAGMMAVGVILESVADAQKKAAKKINKHRFVDTGVYRLVRCPNYLGEILMWWGVGFAVLCVMPERWWLLAGALANTLMFMFISIPLAEGRQSQKPTWQEYKSQTRMLLPIPRFRKATEQNEE